MAPLLSASSSQQPCEGGLSSYWLLPPDQTITLAWSPAASRKLKIQGLKNFLLITVSYNATKPTESREPIGGALDSPTHTHADPTGLILL